VTLPYSKAEFNTDRQAAYKIAMASAAGIAVDRVDILTITERVRRAGGSIDVETRLGADDAAGASAIKATLGTGDARTDKINAALTANGFDVPSPKSTSVAGADETEDSLIIIVVASVVMGVVLVGGTVWHRFWRRSVHKTAPDTSEGKLEAAMPEQGAAEGGNSTVAEGEDVLHVLRGDGRSTPALSPSSALPQAEDKFAGIMLIMGGSDQSDLKEVLGFSSAREFGKTMIDPKGAMQKEWFQNGSAQDIANWEHVVNGTARDDRDIPVHVLEFILQGKYHGGELRQEDFDAGHDGMDLQDFVEHPISVAAGLSDYHVIAARLYTSDSYPLFNRPIRNGVTPHPIRTTMYILDETLDKMKKVLAKSDPAAFARKTKLYRGMKNMRMDWKKFNEVGGVEMAPMSTSNLKSVALNYADGSQGGLLFEYETQGKSMGVSIQYLSVYPKEQEFLYRPLTFLIANGEPYVEDGVQVVPVLPQ
jgi:hypothetical protein